MKRVEILHWLDQEANGSRVIVALDALTYQSASSLIARLDNTVAGIKLTEQIDDGGATRLNLPGAVLKFADVKLHDIPKTVRNRLLSYQARADIVTVHTSAPIASLKAAAEVAAETGLTIVGVTVLTSMSEAECQEVYHDSTLSTVRRLVLRAKDNGLQGVVCSGAEAALVRNVWPEALIITPGIRLSESQQHDQVRVCTPAKATENGADLLVCGREITEATNPTKVVQQINHEVAAVLRKI